MQFRSAAIRRARRANGGSSRIRTVANTHQRDRCFACQQGHSAEGLSVCCSAIVVTVVGDCVISTCVMMNLGLNQLTPHQLLRSISTPSTRTWLQFALDGLLAQKPLVDKITSSQLKQLARSLPHDPTEPTLDVNLSPFEAVVQTLQTQIAQLKSHKDVHAHEKSLQMYVRCHFIG